MLFQDHASWKELVNSAGPDGTARAKLSITWMNEQIEHFNGA